MTAYNTRTNVRRLKEISSYIKVFCLLATALLIFTACGSSEIVRDPQEEQKFAAERERIKKEKAQERETLVTELINRKLPAQTNSPSIWKQFRDTYPYHSQAVALSDDSGDGSKTLIISEPPPHLTIGDVLYPLAKVLLNHSIQKQPVGYDGWTKDVVVAVKGNKSDISESISALNSVLFDTSYKAYVVPLPAQKPIMDTINLDLHVNSNEIKTWLIDQPIKFVPVAGGDELDWAAISKKESSGVYVSDDSALVTWWIPKGGTIQSCKVQARQFTMDSDLIIGAISENGGILIAARKRAVPVDVLPPLRAETLEVLASVQEGQKGQLAQSYERNYDFAGFFGNKDWAPILLSPELVDTEYGSLLNITDQLLKGWSNHGNTKYDNFEKYPIPKSMPFPSDLPTMLDAKQLVYNWNTAGAGYTVDAGQYKVMALNRTGALPVTYIPDGQETNAAPNVKDAMNKGYDYFSTLNDPNLIRVVQYAALYQIFSAFNISKSGVPVTKSDIPQNVRDQMTSETYDKLGSEDAGLDQVARKIAPRLAKYVYPEYSTVSYIKERMGTLSPPDSPGFKLPLPEGEDEKIADLFIRKSVGEILNFPDRYVKEVARQSENRNTWIHTPVVVVSRNVGSLEGATGGHNLDARVTRFRYSETVEPGKTQLVGDDIVINPKDAGKVQSIVRDAGMNQEDLLAVKSRLEQTLTTAAEAAPRMRSSALNLPEGILDVESNIYKSLSTSPAGRLGLVDAKAVTGWGRYASKGRMSDADIALFRESNTIEEGNILIDRGSDGVFRILSDEKRAPIEALTHEDAIDSLVQFIRRNPQVADKKNTLKLDLRGFEEDQASTFLRSVEVRSVDSKAPREIEALVRNERLSMDAIKELKTAKYDFSKAKVIESDIEVLSDGAQLKKIEIEVPLFGDASSSAKTTSYLKFSKSTPREIIELFVARVKQLIEKLKTDFTGKIDAWQYNRRLNLEIKRIANETGVDMRDFKLTFDKERGDAFFGKLEEPGVYFSNEILTEC